MFRCLLAISLALALLAPAAATAKTGCAMDEPALGAAPCDCCEDMTAVATNCAASIDCGCWLANASDARATGASAKIADAPLAVLAELLPAPIPRSPDLRRHARMWIPPPDAAASRAALCSWQL